VLAKRSPCPVLPGSLVRVKHRRVRYMPIVGAEEREFVAVAGVAFADVPEGIPAWFTAQAASTSRVPDRCVAPGDVMVFLCPWRAGLIAQRMGLVLRAGELLWVRFDDVEA